VRRNPLGGALFFNDSVVVRYSQDANFSLFLNSGMLSRSDTNINDVAAGTDGRVYLATDRGIYIWKNGKIIDYIDRMGGIGTSPTVNWVYVDAENRLWFATNDDVGVMTDQITPDSRIAINTIPSTITPVTDTNETYPGRIPTLREDAPMTTPAPNDSEGSLLNVIIDPILQVIQTVLAGLGFR